MGIKMASKDIIYGNIITPNIGSQKVFIKIINQHIDMMQQDTENNINIIFDEYSENVINLSELNEKIQKETDDLTRRYNYEFALFALTFSVAFVTNIVSYSEFNIKRNVKKLSIFDNPPLIKIPRELVDTTQDIAKQYIRNISSTYQSKVKNIALHAAQLGIVAGVASYLIKQRGITKRAAAKGLMNIYRSSFSGITIALMNINGLDKWRWIYTGRSKVPRPYHKNVLKNEIFNINNPPIIDPKTKEHGYPGTLYGCKCVMQPIIELKK